MVALVLSGVLSVLAPCVSVATCVSVVASLAAAVSGRGCF